MSEITKLDDYRKKLKNFWVSWYHEEKFGGFELHFPWWCSGDSFNPDGKMMCAAVKALDEKDAKFKIRDCYDVRLRESDVEWRFCNEREEDWSPFCERFPKADWMRW